MGGVILFDLNAFVTSRGEDDDQNGLAAKGLLRVLCVLRKVIVYAFDPAIEVPDFDKLMNHSHTIPASGV
jgi:hypothetical protein